MTSTLAGIGSSMAAPTSSTISSITGGLTGITGIGGTGTSHGTTSGLVNSSTIHGVITSSTSSHALTDSTGPLTGTAGGNITSFTGANISPLPVRAHQMNAMPPLCQVRNLLYMKF